MIGHHLINDPTARIKRPIHKPHLHQRRHLHPADVYGHGVLHRCALPSTAIAWQLWMDASALHCTEMLPHP